MRDGLREIKFNLNEQDLTLGDLGYDDHDGILNERHGYFHCWGNVEFYDSENGRLYLRKVAIVEESETGKIFEVAPKNIVFKKSIDKL